MRFSAKIKEDILVASARHCCVCHRYKGVKIEIHHIIPKKQGGKDTFENAIPLCFDCHSDAGHYFAKHPKGTKFSINELKKHKENWFKIVQENTIPVKQENIIHARYLITKEFDLLKDISNKNLTRFPIQNCLLLNNQTLEQFKQITKNDFYRNLEIENFLEISPDEYSLRYKDAIRIRTKKGEYQHFYHERIPTKDDIERVCLTDSISKYLLSNGVEPYRISKIFTCYEGECTGSGTFEELFILRPLYFKFLVLTNILDKHIKLKKLDTYCHSEILYNESEMNEYESIKFPNILLEPNQSIIIPIGMFLADFDDLYKSDNYTRIEEIGGDRSIVLDHTIDNKKESIEYIGKNYNPQKLLLNQDGNDYIQDIHTFDFTNLYWIDGFWNCGSCPHLFYKINNNNIIYKGELFNKKPGIETSYLFTVEKNVTQIIIAELEYEITTIKEIIVNNKIIVSNKKLKQYEEYKFAVSENDKVIIKGYYETNSNIIIEMPLMEKSHMIKKYKNNYAQQCI